MTRLACLVLLWLAALAPARAQAPAAQTAAAAQPIRIGFVALNGDPRYGAVRTYGNIVLERREPPYAGAEVGIDEANALAAILHTEFKLERIGVDRADDAAGAVVKASDAGVHFFLLDLPAAAYKPLAAAVRGRNVLLFNVSEPDDGLRRQLCAAEFVHVYPSAAQLSDALVQYLASRKWRNVLALVGPSPADAAMAAAFAHSAQKFGAKIVAQKQFTPGTDPRQREQNNPALLSAIGQDYDVAYVADEAFDFARSVPYRMVRPRLVVGSIDLRPVAWHWTWEYNGAPQVDLRFEKISGGRHMSGRDWAAWFAVKMIAQSALQTQSTDFAKQRGLILGDGAFDGDKGLALSVRHWDHQVRQAVLLAAPYEVVADAPVEGFLHRTNVLDTLGDDQPESPCHLDK
jgi:ABC transporter substrate binding protein (PQQ-dependent alcohol dehydrogenase system)